MGGAGLVFTEMTCVERRTRASRRAAPGIWNDEQRAAWKRIVDFVHDRTPAKIALQLGHAGPKGSTQLGGKARTSRSTTGNWPLLGRLGRSLDGRATRCRAR